MKRYKPFQTFHTFQTFVLAAALTGAASASRAELVNGIKAVVHDSVITYEEVEQRTLQTADVLRRQYRGQPEQFQKKMDDSRTENLEFFVSRQLILHEFQTAGYHLPESVIDEMVQERIREQFGNRVTMTKTLQSEGLTYEKLRQRIRDQFIVDALRQKNVSSEVIISPHKVEAFYQAHQGEFKVEDEVKLRMIVLTNSTSANAPDAKKLAEEILSKIKEGVPFGEMAKIHSVGSQRKEGGDWGWVDHSVLRKDLADVAFGLKPGEVSPVIETAGAIYLMQVEDTRVAHHKSLEEVRDQVEQTLRLQERTRLEKQWIDRLKKKTFYRYF